MKTQIKQFDLYGKRNHKYDFLLNNNIKSINWNNLNPTEPYYFLANKNFDEIMSYENGFTIDELMNYTAGIQTVRDTLTIHIDERDLKSVVHDFLDLDEDKIIQKYNTNDARDWKIKRAKEDIKNNIENNNVWQKIHYRPFDIRNTFYSGTQNGFVCNGRYKISKHFLKPNIGITFNRNIEVKREFYDIFIINFMADGHSLSMKEHNYFAPLYLYPDQGEQGEIIEQERTPNLNPEIVKEIEEVLGLKFVAEKPPSTTLRELNSSSLSENNPSSLSEVEVNTFAPIDLLDYIYAVLHSPAYREKYKEFLKIDFPRVPYPKIDTFWKLVEIGKQIREIHLLESPEVENYITKYPINGSNIVEKVTYKESKVYINKEQYFDGVPEVAWNFYIGGYQPAQKWLKDRKGRELNFDDIMHYQKIIIALSETDKLMKEIDKVGVE